MAKVAYTMENVDRCRCGKCPVYLSSPCAIAKNETITWTPGILPPAGVIEGIYCAEPVGKSKCSDLDSSRSCSCPTCQVWKDYGLTSTYFCIHGPEV